MQLTQKAGQNRMLYPFQKLLEISDTPSDVNFSTIFDSSTIVDYAAIKISTSRLMGKGVKNFLSPLFYL